jgi:hypothetical protein
MPTSSPFSQRLDLADISSPAKSVGAHLAAKLQLFHTDERTLTDELCDMLCIWLGMQAGRRAKTFATQGSFILTLSKTTASEEFKNGADLELFVSSPLGVKRCLMQAKVLDPVTRKLRCDSVVGWQKLRTQLVAARKEVGDLAFLLVYVPDGILNGKRYGYLTYEQGRRQKSLANGVAPAYFGATLIPVNALLGPSGRWRNTKLKVPQPSKGKFKDGLALWRVLIELLLCRRSSWSADTGSKHEKQMRAFRRLSIDVSGINEDMWRELQAKADQFLPPDEVADSDNDDS